MNYSVDSGCRGDRVEKNLVPFGVGQIGGEDRAFSLVAVRNELKKQVGTFGVVWGVAQFVADDDVKAIKRLLETADLQVFLGHQKIIYQLMSVEEPTFVACLAQLV